jgi:hypothetical protein
MGRPRAHRQRYLCRVTTPVAHTTNTLPERQATQHGAFRALSVTGLVTGASVLTLGLATPDAIRSGVVLLLSGAALAVFITSRLARIERSSGVWWFAAAFATKQWITLLVLFGGWVPHLDQNDPRYGYDPQRFHFEAWELARSGFDPTTIQLLSLNYGGVLYYYGAAFSVFGWSPVVPALLNCITTLTALGVALWGMPRLLGRPLGFGWMLGGVLLVPDLLWFDVVASRESLLSALVMVVMVLVCLQLRGLVRRGALLVAALGCVGIAALRPPVLIPVVLAIVAAALLLKRRNARSAFSGKGVALLVAAAAVGIVAAATLLSTLLGGYDVNLLRDVSAIATATSESSLDFEWASSSVARRLIPSASWQVVPFALARLVLFFVAPWPSPVITLAGLADGRWSDWQSVFLAISSPLYWLAAPVIAAAGVRAWRTKQDRTELTLHLATFALLLTIAGGNVIVQERYRVMGIGLLLLSFLCARRDDLPLARRFGAMMVVAGVAGSVLWVVLKV